jgi:hypothetical protein
MAENTDDLIDYEEEEEAVAQTVVANTAAPAAANGDAKVGKGSYVGIHATGFRDFLLKPELLRAIVDCGFEHPSEGKRVVFSYPSSPARVYSAGYSWYGCAMSGKVRNG